MIFFGKVINRQIDYSNKREIEKFLESIEDKAVWVRIEKMRGVRTLPQNNALHLFCEQLAETLNNAGLPIQVVLKEVVDIDWNKDTVKELIWRPIQKAITNKESTTELDKVSEITEIYEHINRHFGERFGIHVPFPTDQMRDVRENVYSKN